jgi:F-type H+-transporting ATPase subunit a
VHLLALDFPGIDRIVTFKPIAFGGSLFEFNKVALITVLAMVATAAIFFFGGRKRALVPTGIQNVAEFAIETMEREIVMQTMGVDGMKFLPYLTSLFFFVFFCNITEIIPVLQMPASARMAIPIMLAVLTWLIFNAVGVMSQGAGGYLKNSLFPPGVPKALYLLVTPIEFISTFIVRPFSLAVRLFANMLAGHILLVTFSVLSTALIEGAIALKVITVASGAMFVAMTFFEILVSLLQAYIFTILTAVYIGGSMHPEH